MSYSVKSLKIFLAILILAFGVSGLFGESFYDSHKDSVVYLEHSIFLDAKYCTDPKLFREFEIETDEDIMDSFIYLASGSGFIIDEEGHLLTNRHVVQLIEFDRMIELYGDSIFYELLEISDDVFSDKEIETLWTDFNSMFVHGTLEFRGYTDVGSYEVEILETASEDMADLALAKLTSKKSQFQPLRLADESLMGSSLVGNEVYSLGYPLGMTMNDLFEDRQVTMNKGFISSYRRDELSIQHNADISSGNSGGPLLDDSGLVLGINTALIEEGNSLYYAIGIDRVRDFLESGDYSYLLNWNDRISVNPSGELNFIYKNDDSVTLRIDGRYIGQNIQNLKLPPGSYQVEFLSSNRIYEDLTVNLKPNDKVSSVITGKVGTPLHLYGLKSSSEDIQLELIYGYESRAIKKKITFLGEHGQKLEYAPNDNISLSPGHWDVTVIGYDRYEGLVIPLQITEEEYVLDFEDLFATSTLEIRNFIPGTQVFVDGKAFPYGGETPLELPLGQRKVYLWKNGNIPVSRKIEIMVDGSAVITQPRKWSHGKRAVPWLLAGTGLSAIAVVSEEENQGTIAAVAGVFFIPAMVEYFLHRADKAEYKRISGQY